MTENRGIYSRTRIEINSDDGEVIYKIPVIEDPKFDSLAAFFEQIESVIDGFDQSDKQSFASQAKRRLQKERYHWKTVAVSTGKGLSSFSN